MPGLNDIETLPDDDNAAEFLLAIPRVRQAIEDELKELREIEDSYSNQLAAMTLREMLDRTELHSSN